MPLPTRQLGDSGITVSVIGFGLAAVGRPGYINLSHTTDLGPDKTVAGLQSRAVQVLHAAHDAGVTYFDAARSYGQSEAFLAAFLDEVAGDDALVVGSKWGYRYTAGWRTDAEVHEVKDHSLAHFRTQKDESWGLLGGSGKLKLYQIHSATIESGVLDDAELHSALASFREQTGLKLGFSASGPNQSATIRKALALKVNGRRLFDTVQATFNIFEPSAGTALAEAKAAGLGVIIKESVANGRLIFGLNTDPRDQVCLAKLAKLAEQKGISTDVLAMAAVANQPFVDVVLSGASTVEQVESNVRAAHVVLTPEEMAYLFEEGNFAEEPKTYWTRRSSLSWN